MQPWETLDRTTTPDGQELLLCRRGDELAVRVGGRLLMSSRQHGSEEALARRACGALAKARSPALLVGGLGMGFTLRAALDLLPRSAHVLVAELVPALVAWNRGPLATLAGRPLGDPRVELATGDVGAVLAAKSGRFDAILLDVDNGPAALTTPANAALYGAGGLANAHRALRSPGTLVVWSAADDPRFVRRLEQAGFRARSERVEARTGRGGSRHVLFVGER